MLGLTSLLSGCALLAAPAPVLPPIDIIERPTSSPSPSSSSCSASDPNRSFTSQPRSTGFPRLCGRPDRDASLRLAKLLRTPKRDHSENPDLLSRVQPSALESRPVQPVLRTSRFAAGPTSVLPATPSSSTAPPERRAEASTLSLAPCPPTGSSAALPTSKVFHHAGTILPAASSPPVASAPTGSPGSCSPTSLPASSSGRATAHPGSSGRRRPASPADALVDPASRSDASPSSAQPRDAPAPLDPARDPVRPAGVDPRRT